MHLTLLSACRHDAAGWMWHSLYARVAFSLVFSGLVRADALSSALRHVGGQVGCLCRDRFCER